MIGDIRNPVTMNSILSSVSASKNIPVPYTHPNLPAYALPVIVKERTTDAKLGNCSATHASQHSCPKTCPWFNAGCYAETGPQGMQSRKLNANAETDPLAIAKFEADGILALSGKRDLRLHIVGDCDTADGARLLADAAAVHVAKYGRRVWTYTHSKNTSRADWGCVSVLRSEETLEGLEEAHAAGFASAMVRECPRGEDGKLSGKPVDLGSGFKGVTCLHQTGKKLDCVECGLCMGDARLHATKTVVLFDPHGSLKNTIRKHLVVLNS